MSEDHQSQTETDRNQQTVWALVSATWIVGTFAIYSHDPVAVTAVLDDGVLGAGKILMLFGVSVGLSQGARIMIESQALTEDTNELTEVPWDE